MLYIYVNPFNLDFIKNYLFYRTGKAKIITINIKINQGVCHYFLSLLTIIKFSVKKQREAKIFFLMPILYP